MRTVAETYLLLIITSTADGLSRVPTSMTLNDLTRVDVLLRKKIVTLIWRKYSHCVTRTSSHLSTMCYSSINQSIINVAVPYLQQWDR